MFSRGLVRAPLVCTGSRQITVPPYQASDFITAAKLGHFTDRNFDFAAKLFGQEPVGLERGISIDLIYFNRPDWFKHEVVAWAKDNGRQFIEMRHTMGIAIGLPELLAQQYIFDFSCIKDGYALALGGHYGHRYMECRRVTEECRHDWWHRCTVGFLSK